MGSKRSKLPTSTGEFNGFLNHQQYYYTIHLKKVAVDEFTLPVFIKDTLQVCQGSEEWGFSSNVCSSTGILQVFFLKQPMVRMVCDTNEPWICPDLKTKYVVKKSFHNFPLGLWAFCSWLAKFC